MRSGASPGSFILEAHVSPFLPPPVIPSWPPPLRPCSGSQAVPHLAPKAARAPGPWAACPVGPCPPSWGKHPPCPSHPTDCRYARCCSARHRHRCSGRARGMNRRRPAPAVAVPRGALCVALAGSAPPHSPAGKGEGYCGQEKEVDRRRRANGGLAKKGGMSPECNQSGLTGPVSPQVERQISLYWLTL